MQSSVGAVCWILLQLAPYTVTHIHFDISFHPDISSCSRSKACSYLCRDGYVWWPWRSHDGTMCNATVTMCNVTVTMCSATITMCNATVYTVEGVSTWAHARATTQLLTLEWAFSQSWESHAHINGSGSGSMWKSGRVFLCKHACSMLSSEWIPC